jgi:hypothetical protein
VTADRSEQHLRHRVSAAGGLVDRQQDTSGDYGYDEAHEVTGRQQTRPASTGGQRTERRPPERRSERTGDLEYDEAHDF